MSAKQAESQNIYCVISFIFIALLLKTMSSVIFFNAVKVFGAT